MCDISQSSDCDLAQAPNHPQLHKKGNFRPAKVMDITMQIHFPKFTSSDKELDITYNYRCEVYQRHVKETPDGHVITEFLPGNFAAILAWRISQTRSVC